MHPSEGVYSHLTPRPCAKLLLTTPRKVVPHSGVDHQVKLIKRGVTDTCFLAAASWVVILSFETIHQGRGQLLRIMPGKGKKRWGKEDQNKSNADFLFSLSLCVSLCLSLCLFLCVCVSVCFFLCLSLSLIPVSFSHTCSLSMCLSLCPSLCLCLSLSLPVPLSLSVSPCLCLSLSVSLSLSLSLSVFLQTVILSAMWNPNPVEILFEIVWKLLTTGLRIKSRKQKKTTENGSRRGA